MQGNQETHPEVAISCYAGAGLFTLFLLWDLQITEQWFLLSDITRASCSNWYHAFVSVFIELLSSYLLPIAS